MPELAEAVIVGGGILGAALAYELTKRRWRVTLLEAERCGGRATSGGFTWVNATSKTENEEYHRLNAQSVAFYAALALEWGADRIGLHSGGSLFWASSDEEADRICLKQRSAILQAWGYPVSTLSSAEMRLLEPQIQFAESAEGLYSPADFWIDTSRLIRFYMERIHESGGDIREYSPAIGFTRDRSNQVTTVETAQGRIGTPILILAAGVQTSTLLPLAVGLPSEQIPSLLNRVPGLLLEIPKVDVSSPIHRVLYPSDPGGLHLRPTPVGGLLIGAEDVDASYQKTIRQTLLERENQHRSAAVGDEMNPATWNEDWNPEVAAEAGRELLARTISHLPQLAPFATAGNLMPRLCMRPMPKDELPIIGPFPDTGGIYLMVTHSGVTLGPFLARLLADEIVAGRLSSQLVPYRVTRFSR
jgi:glycine/D-amino acid oxidase-like deaminating enzyme